MQIIAEEALDEQEAPSEDIEPSTDIAIAAENSQPPAISSPREVVPHLEPAPSTEQPDTEPPREEQEEGVTRVKNEQHVPHEESEEEKEARENLEAVHERNRTYSKVEGNEGAEEIDWSEVSAPIELTKEDLKERARDETFEQIELGWSLEDQRLKDVQERLREHAEAMHTIAKEENNINDPESLKSHLESLEASQAEKGSEANKPKNEEASNKGEELGKKAWKDLSTPQKIAKGAAFTGLTAGGAYLSGSAALWAGAAGASALGLTGGAFTGTAIGLGAFSGLATLGVFAYIEIQLWKSIREDWRSLVQSLMPFSFIKIPGASGGGAKKPQGGGGGAPAGGGGHGGGH